ncbi:MAG: transcriptional repressor LexA [Lentisphaeraceae bacterium]|nr:transcriptional repressor LexA [Lentisphaeraceae bacterium]
MKGLTDKQKEILDYIENFLNTNGMAPTVYEIADNFQIKSATSFAHIRALQRKGYLTRSSKARSLALTKTTTMPRHLSMSLSVPMLGRISAGMPLMSDQHVEKTIQIDPKILPSWAGGDKLFALQVNGESMRDAGILDGDTIIASQVSNPSIGDIVVAMVNGDTTVKTLFIKNGQVELRPSNPDFKTQIYDAAEVQVQGKVVALQRTY